MARRIMSVFCFGAGFAARVATSWNGSFVASLPTQFRFHAAPQERGACRIRTERRGESGWRWQSP